MIFERHKRGKIYDQTEICDGSILCPISFAAGEADIWQSNLTRSRVNFNSRLRGSRIFDSVIGAEGSQVEIVDSMIRGSEIKGGQILRALVDNSVIEGAAYVRGGTRGVQVINSQISGDVLLENEVRISGVTLHSEMRMGFGNWNRAPRYAETTGEAGLFCMTESNDDYAYIECTRKKMTDWIKKKNAWARVGRWSGEMRDFVHQTFENWLDNPMPIFEVEKL